MKHIFYLLVFLLTITIIPAVIAQSVCGDEICEDEELLAQPDFCPQDCAHCVDTDGDDIFTAGQITFNREEVIPDRCAKDIELGRSQPELGNVLFESYCTNEFGPNTGGAGSRNVECEFGCENGACLGEPLFFAGCTDSDNGNNPNTQGTTSYQSDQQRDTCLDVTRGQVRECSGGDCKLYEYYCNQGNQGLKPDDVITFDSISCSIGCKDGECIACTGCVRDGECYEVGSVIEFGFCGDDFSFQPLKVTGASCANDYECQINRCSQGICQPECQGCFVNKQCLPFGTRDGAQFCSLSGEMVVHQANGAACTNNFECASNICIDDQCKAGSIAQRFFDWLGKLFG